MATRIGDANLMFGPADNNRLALARIGFGPGRSGE